MGVGGANLRGSLAERPTTGGGRAAETAETENRPSLVWHCRQLSGYQADHPCSRSQPEGHSASRQADGSSCISCCQLLSTLPSLCQQSICRRQKGQRVSRIRCAGQDRSSSRPSATTLWAPDDRADDRGWLIERQVGIMRGVGEEHGRQGYPLSFRWSAIAHVES